MTSSRISRSYGFLIFLAIFGFFLWRPLGFLLGLAAALAFEYFFPPKPTYSKGLPRRRTNTALLLLTLYFFFSQGNMILPIAEGAIYRFVGLWGMSNGSALLPLFHFLGFLNGCLFGYQAYLARRSAMFNWMWFYGSIAVFSLVFSHFMVNGMGLVFNRLAAIAVFVSLFLFRLPSRFNDSVEVAGARAKEPLSMAELEAELNALKRLLHEGTLSQEEFDAQKQSMLSRRN